MFLIKHVKYLEEGLSPELEWECSLKDSKKHLNSIVSMEEVKKSWLILESNKL